MRAYAYGARPPIQNAELVRQQLILAHRYGNCLVEIERAHRQEVEDAEEDEALVKAAHEKAAAAVRAARGECGVFWGTYLIVEDALQRSRRTGAEPRFRRFDGTGTLAVQIQGGLPVEELLAGEDRRARLLGEGRHRTLHVRVGSAGRDPVWATFPIVYHRDLPAQSTVKWVRCVCRRIGTHYKWSAQIVLDDLPDQQLPAPTRGTIAIDVGWRRVPGGLHVATWVDDAGETGEVVLPERLQDRAGKVADLAAIRDKNFNAARDVLRAWRGEAATLPEWFQEATTSLHAWRAARGDHRDPLAPQSAGRSRRLPGCRTAGEGARHATGEALAKGLRARDMNWGFLWGRGHASGGALFFRHGTLTAKAMQRPVAMPAEGPCASDMPTWWLCPREGLGTPDFPEAAM